MEATARKVTNAAAPEPKCLSGEGGERGGEGRGGQGVRGTERRDREGEIGRRRPGLVSVVILLYVTVLIQAGAGLSPVCLRSIRGRVADGPAAPRSSNPI